MKNIFNLFSIFSFLVLFSVSSFGAADGVDPNSGNLSGNGSGLTAIGGDCPTGTCHKMEQSQESTLSGTKTIFRPNGPILHKNTSGPVETGL